MTLTELIQNNPRIAIIVLSFLVTLFITIINNFMIDKKRMGEIKEKQKGLREELKKHKDNPQKMMELNKQMMEDMPEQLKHSFKPMIITFIPIIIFFGFIRNSYAETAIAGTWFWWYLGASILSSIAFRKLFKLP